MSGRHSGHFSFTSTVVNTTKTDAQKHKLDVLKSKFDRKIPVSEMYGLSNITTSNWNDLQRELAESEKSLVYRDMDKRLQAALDEKKRQRETEVENRKIAMERDVQAHFALQAELDKETVKRRVTLDELNLAIETRRADCAAQAGEISRADERLEAVVQNIARVEHVRECGLQRQAMCNRLYEALFPIRFALTSCDEGSVTDSVGETEAKKKRATRCKDPKCRERFVGIAKLPRTDRLSRLHAFEVNLHENSTAYLRTLVWSFLDAPALEDSEVN